jgi:type IV pilus assembly protein PilF
MKTLIALLLATALTACVSTTSRPRPTPDKDAATYNMQLGISYLRQGNLQAAREKLERAIDLEPGLATAHSALGLVFERLDDADGAERHYRRAVEVDGRDPDSLNALAVFTCSRRQKPAEALRLFDRALAVPLSVKNANRAMLYTNAGTCVKQSDPARAETYLRGALAQDPQYADALLQLADVSLVRGNGLAARGFLERHLARAPASAEALWLGVRIEQSMNDANAARGYGDRLRREFPESTETRRWLEQSRSRG